MRSTIETGRYLTRQIDAVQLGKETAKNEKELSADKIAGLLKHSASWSLTREIINKYNRKAGKEPKIAPVIQTEVPPAEIDQLIRATNYIHNYHFRYSGDRREASAAVVVEIETLLENEIEARKDTRESTVKGLFEKKFSARLTARDWVNTLRLQRAVDKALTTGDKRQIKRAQEKLDRYRVVHKPTLEDNNQELVTTLDKFHNLNFWKYGTNHSDLAFLDTITTIEGLIAERESNKKRDVIYTSTVNRRRVKLAN